jgi:uncharacterized damage-inducible protein DinB
MKRNHAMMAAYNEWANRRLFDACARLTEDNRRAGLGAFFGSLHGTLNHMMVADRIWRARITGAAPPDLALDDTVHDDFGDLRKAREAEDARWIAMVDGLDDATLSRPISYETITQPTRLRQPLWSALMHAFNHQTHHRGQCHGMLTRLVAEAPSFDLIQFQRETGEGLLP